MAVYFFEVAPGFVKIGYSKSIEGVRRRLKQARCWCPVVRVLCVLPEGTPATEKAFHAALEGVRLEREVFRLSDVERTVSRWDRELRPRRVELDTRLDRELDARLKRERREALALRRAIRAYVPKRRRGRPAKSARLYG